MTAKRIFRLYLFRTFLTVTMLLLFGGCATSTSRTSRSMPTGLALGDAIVIFPNGMGPGSIESSHFVECVHKALLSNKPDQRFVAADTFKDALFPWFEEAPKTPDEFHRLLARPLVQDRISQLGVRYIVVLAGGTKNDGSLLRPFLCGSTGCLGLTWWDRKTDLLAIVWDMKAGEKAGELLSTASGTAVVPAFFLPIPLIPRTETTACSELGRRLVEFLNQ